MTVFRYRIQFAKTAPLRFISHLDLHRTWERTLRRAEVPLAYTQGYNPHPRINIGAALPLGCTSQGDLMDVYLEQEWDTAPLEVSLRRAASPGLEVQRVDRISSDEPALQRIVCAAEYRVVLDAGVSLEALQSKVDTLLACQALPRERRGKSYDLRPLIRHLQVERGGGDQPPALRMQLVAREGATGRPDEVLESMGLEPASYVPARLKLIRATDTLHG